MPPANDANLAPPVGVSTKEAEARNLDQAAAGFERFLNPPRARAADGKFASAQPPALATFDPNTMSNARGVQPATGEQPDQGEASTDQGEQPEGQPNAAVEGETVEDAEERFEIELGEGEKVELTASELAKLVAEQRKPPTPEPARESEASIVERARLAQEREQLARERQAYAQRVNDFIPQALRALQQDFPDITSQEALYKLSVEDPARYVQFQARRDALISAQNEQQRMQAQFNEEQRVRAAKYLEEQQAALHKAVPVFADPVKGPAEKQALRTYLTGKGFTEDELAGLTDHRTVIVARNAMLYERMMAAKPEAKKVASVVRAIRPGAARPATSSPNASQAAQAARDNLKKTGTVDALAAAFRSQGIR